MTTERQRYLRSFIGREVITLNGVAIGKVHKLNLNMDDEIESLVILSSSLFPSKPTSHEVVTSIPALLKP
ncbi:hypothetical protein TUMEXPCC7403_14100 [Tumidithrix helvetica PCC 7403]|uniref:PRC-barrel domain-containing protein n=1 Tax=Tumidithrix helvetica TaxID=3457545 RepID=UPI003CAC3521